MQDDAKTFRQLCAIVRDCLKVEASDIGELSEVVKVVLARRRIYYKPFDLHRAISTVFWRATKGSS